MAYTLSGTSIRPPYQMQEHNDTQVAQVRTLSGTVARDYFGSNKRVWTLSYRNTNATDFATINTIYQNYLSTNTVVSWVVDETNYTVSSTNVHVDIRDRNFSTLGTDYLSEFTLILTEA